LTDGDIPYISQTSSRPFLVVPGKTAAAFWCCVIQTCVLPL
jgi:hypothetical protein